MKYYTVTFRAIIQGVEELIATMGFKTNNKLNPNRVKGFIRDELAKKHKGKQIAVIILETNEHTKEAYEKLMSENTPKA